MTLGDELPEAMLVERELERGSRSRFVPAPARTPWRDPEEDLHRAIEETGWELAALLDQQKHLPALIADAREKLSRFEAALEALRAGQMAHPSFVSRIPDSPDPRLCPGMGVDEREQFR